MDSYGTEPSVLTVSQLNQRARQLLERSFALVQVSGEVSSLKIDASGHHWFSLKDAGGALNAVMFRNDARNLRFGFKVGVQVVATGRLTIYPATGRYQMVVGRLEPAGAGAQQLALQQLKARLQAEGLFDSAKKRPLPALPRRVAVVTSPTGAVIRDIVQVSMRRFPNAQIVLIPTRVQGPDCGLEIARAIARASAYAAQPTQRIDALIVARGGGSAEDLWGFNDERVVRAIAAASVPVVSAVGHETDVTLADFAADRRAPTPSAAAELIFPLKSELTFRVQRLVLRMTTAVRRELQHQRVNLRALRAELGDGRAPLELQAQRLAHLRGRLEAGMQRRVAFRRHALSALHGRLQALHPRNRLQSIKQRLTHVRARLALAAPRHVKRPRERLAHVGARLALATPHHLQKPRERLAHLSARLALAAPRHVQKPREQLALIRARVLAQGPRHVQEHRRHLAHLGQRLHALSPLAVLGRGYGIVLTAEGQAVRDAAEVKPGDSLDLRVQRGHIRAVVESAASNKDDGAP